MPQGPVGRGCTACRAQKKKCDLLKPACSRCLQRRISCVGCGEKRFKFSSDKRTMQLFTQSQSHILTTSSSPLHFKAPASGPVSAQAQAQVAHTPSNEITRLQQAVNARLQDEISYSIVFRWGTFLAEIPQRLGASATLDAAVAALLARHSEAAMRQDQSDSQAPAVIAYNRGLAALRTTLDDPRESSSYETLCAVMLLVYCQARFDDQFTFFWSPHGPGIAQLLRMRGFACGKNHFENSLLGPLCFTLILQSFANPVINLSATEYHKLRHFFENAATISAADGPRLIITMIDTSELMARARQTLISSHKSRIQALVKEAKELAGSLNLLLASMREQLRLSQIQEHNNSYNLRMYAIHQRVFGVALSASAILLCVRRRLSPLDTTVIVDAMTLCQEVLRVTHDAQIFRPLGAVWTVHVLICAWCAVQDLEMKARIEHELLDYQRDAMGPKVDLQIDRLRILERRLSLFE